MGELVVYVSISKTSLDLCERLETGRKIEDINAAGFGLDIIKVPSSPSNETLKVLESLKITRLPALFEKRTRETFIGIGDILKRIDRISTRRAPPRTGMGDFGNGGELGAWQAREMYNMRGSELVPRGDDEEDETKAFERDIDRKMRRQDNPRHRAPREQEAREPPRGRARRRSFSPPHARNRSRSDSPRNRSESPVARRPDRRRDNIDEEEEEERPRGRAAGRRGGGGGSGEDQMDDRMMEAFLENNDGTNTV